MKKTLSLASLFLAATVAACATPDSQDTKLSLDVQHSINSHPALLTDLLRVQAADHVVYLSGMTDTWVEYYEAEDAARAVPGVVRVVNKLEVRQGRV
jgi:osmotically-inducible protein OsmY